MPTELGQRRELSFALVIAVFAEICPSVAVAQVAGQQLAIDYRSACHRVTADQGLPPPVAVDAGGSTEFYLAPSFRQVAGDASKDRAYLQKYIRRPHYPMQEQVFISQELDAITDYILSLRSEPADW